MLLDANPSPQPSRELEPGHAISFGMFSNSHSILPVFHGINVKRKAGEISESTETNGIGDPREYNEIENLRAESGKSNSVKSVKSAKPLTAGKSAMKHFERLTRLATQHGRQHHRFLLLDGFKCHISCQVFVFALRHNIHDMNLPAQTTHLMQPQDAGVYSPLLSDHGVPLYCMGYCTYQRPH